MRPVYLYDDNEARDDHGRWTDGDSGATSGGGSGKAKTADEWSKSLTPKEQAAIEFWKYGDYNTMRKDIMSGKLNEQEQTFKDALARAPSFEGIAYRGMKNVPEPCLKDLLTVGTTIELKAPSSWTKYESQSRKFFDYDKSSVRMVVDLKKNGVDLNEQEKGNANYEAEVVVKGGSFKVTKVEAGSKDFGPTDSTVPRNYHVIHLQEL